MAAVYAAPSLARPRAPRAFRKSGARVSVRAVRVTATADAAKYDTVIIGAGVSGPVSYTHLTLPTILLV